MSEIPANDWIALGLLGWMLAMVGWSVQLAQWGDLPSIVPASLFATALAFFMLKIRLPKSAANWFWNSLIQFVVFVAGGIIVVFWQGALNAEGDNPIARSVDAWDRFALWLDIAINGGVSADQVPFAMLMMTASWVISYIVTTLTFRFNSPWIPAAVLGTALLTNLSHRIGLHEQTFYLFMVAAIALFSHMVAVGRINQWRKSGLTAPREARWIAARDGLILAFFVMVIAALMPMFTPRSHTLSDRWNTVFLDPFTQFRDTAERLLAGIPSGDDDLIYSPNAVLPFQGGIQLTDDPVMWIRTRYAKLHPARVYQTYSSQGWTTAPSVALPADSGTKLLVDPADLEIEGRARLDIGVEPLGKTDRVIPAGAVYAVDYPVDVEVLEPLTWDVPLAGSPAKLAELPDDLREFAFTLRERLMEMAEKSPAYSPPEQDKDRPPFTLNTQPAMTKDEVNTAIRQIQSGMFTPAGLEEQITYSITSSSLEEMSLDNAGEVEYMIFTMSDTALTELLSADDETPDSVGIRVSSLALKEQADINGVAGPDRMMFVLTAADLMSLVQPDLDPLGSPNRRDTTRFKITAENLEAMDLARSRIVWRSFNWRVFAETDGTNAMAVRLARRGPTEQNTVSFDQVLEESQSYAVTTFVSTAEVAELEKSTARYPSWIADRYLQLPETLPREVRELAREVVENARAESPWEKTMAIKEFLQDQVYSLEIEGPGPFDDGVHYFLFETINEPCPTDRPDCDTSKIKGYSQYYGSAATVMLRSVGVPSRMIAGWSAGEYVPDQGQFLIRDRNRHGWTQIYAPPYGWIDVEVTPGRAVVPRNVLVPTSPTSGLPPGLIGSAEFDPDYLQYLEDLDEIAMMEQDLLRSGRLSQFEDERGTAFDLPLIPTASVVAFLAIVSIVVVGWRWNLRGQPEAVRAYSQFLRVASLLGFRRPSHESAREFTNRIGDMTVRYGDARKIIDAFERCVYGPGESSISTDETPVPEADSDPTDTDVDVALGKAWRSLARAMFKYRIMSILGMTPTYVPNEGQEQYRFAS